MIGGHSVLEWDRPVPLEAIMGLLSPKIAEITAEGISLAGDVASDEINLSCDDVALRGALAVALDLRMIDRTICVTGAVEGTAIRQCVRCVKDFDDPMAFSVHAAYEREGKPAAQSAKPEPSWKKKTVPEVEVEPEELNDDLYYYAGEYLDMAPMLREQVILASPMHPLCAEDCQGLCARCGKDLNEGPCHCATESVESPFHVLRAMKDKIQTPADR